MNVRRDSLLHRARRIVRRTGIDVHRWPARDPEFLAFRAFTAGLPDVIFDVGANDGGFARQCRDFGYTGQIVSFEPGSEAYSRLVDASAADPLWDAQRLALGRDPGQLELQVAGNAGASSSFLPMTHLHQAAATDACYVAAEMVPVARLDDVIRQVGWDWRRPALKIDTQGFEREVLEGATQILQSAVAVRIELSLVTLYDGAFDWREAVDWMSARGFDLVGLVPGFSDPRSGSLLQFDGVFARRAPQGA